MTQYICTIPMSGKQPEDDEYFINCVDLSSSQCSAVVNNRDSNLVQNLHLAMGFIFLHGAMLLRTLVAVDLVCKQGQKSEVAHDILPL